VSLETCLALSDVRFMRALLKETEGITDSIVRCLQAAALVAIREGLSGLRLTCWPGGVTHRYWFTTTPQTRVVVVGSSAGLVARWAPLCRSDAGRERIGASQADDPQGRRKPMRQPTLVASVAACEGGRLQLVPRFGPMRPSPPGWSVSRAVTE